MTATCLSLRHHRVCVWVFLASEVLQTRHTAALMALDLSTVRFSRDTSECWFRQRMGLATHVANFGLVLMVALAPPVPTCLSYEPDVDELNF